jgi:hypothetical protein
MSFLEKQAKGFRRRISITMYISLTMMMIRRSVLGRRPLATVVIVVVVVVVDWFGSHEWAAAWS